MKDSKVWAAAHHMAVATVMTRNQNTTGRRPKYALRMTTTHHRLAVDSRLAKQQRRTSGRGHKMLTKNATNSKHKDISRLRVVNLVRGHAPFGGLGNKCDCAGRTAIVWQE